MNRRHFLRTSSGATFATGWLPLPIARGDSTDPLFEACELLGCPTDQSITVNMLPASDVDVFFEYGTVPGVYSGQTPTRTHASNAPLEVVIDGLRANTRYYYRTRYRPSGGGSFAVRPERSFHTQRPRGASFVVTITADTHPNDNSNPAMYERTLGNVAAARPDLHFDLGDTFMSDKLPKPFNSPDIDAATRNHRPWHEIVAHSSPLFLGLGNHEGEAGWLHDGTSNNISAWALAARKLYYPNPAPDGFYSGNLDDDPVLGLKENYYAFEWGDALFVMLDPYWYTMCKPSNSLDEWDWSLGIVQYLWLKQTLEISTARHKIILTHHLVGGNPNIAIGKDKLIGRGGIEAAPYGEWGGLNLLSDTLDSWGWDTNRPATQGWDKPVHQILVENGVSLVVHGHDHAYVKQELDGIIYQLMPQPANLNINGTNSATAGGYVNGDILPNSGHLRLAISPDEISVEYVRTYTPEQENGARSNGDIGASYSIAAPTPEEITGLAVERVVDDIVLQWDADPGIDYTVKWSADLRTWNSIPVGQVGTWTDPNPPAARKFYRVTR
ncbi:MAG: metallophosphoesterase [Ilumatobacter sp.]|nr:metallophosphoesterase [Ilumatobacter sp.]